MGNALSKPRSLMASSSSCFIPSSSNCAIFLTQQWPNALPLRHYSGGAPGALLLNHGGPARSSRMRLPAARAARTARDQEACALRRGEGRGHAQGASRGTCAFVGCYGAAGAAGTGVPRASAVSCAALRGRGASNLAPPAWPRHRTGRAEGGSGAAFGAPCASVISGGPARRDPCARRQRRAAGRKMLPDWTNRRWGWGRK